MIRNVIDIMIGGFDNGRTPHVQQYDVESREYECRLWRAPGLPYQLAEDALVGVVYRWRRNPGSKEYETKLENRSTVVVKIPQEAMKMDGIVTMQLRLHEGGTVLNGPEIEFVVLRSIEPGDDEGDEPVPLLVALVGQTQEVLTQIRTALENGEFNGKDGAGTVINLVEKYGVDPVYDHKNDCTALINRAIRDAAEEGKRSSAVTLYLPPGRYYTLGTIVVSKSVNLKFDGAIEYQGTDYAIAFSNYSYCKAEIHRIRAPNGSCMKLIADSSAAASPENNKNIVYSSFCFDRLSANEVDGYCIYAETKGTGYIGQNKFVGGKCEGGYTAFKVNNIDCYEYAFGGNLFENIAIEGSFDAGSRFDTGFHFTDFCTNNMLINCNLEESGDGYLKGIVTEGRNSGLKIINSSNFYRSYMSLSPETDGMIISSMRDTNGELLDTFARIVRGEPVLERHDRTKYLLEHEGEYDMATKIVIYEDTEHRKDYSEIGYIQYNDEYSNFIVGGNCTGIRLSKKYGHVNGINDFTVAFEKDNIGAFPIKDFEGNEIDYVVPQTAGIIVHFKWRFEAFETGRVSKWTYSYEFTNLEQLQNSLSASDNTTFATAILNTVEGGSISDAGGGKAASVVTTFSPALENGALAPSADGGLFANPLTLKLNVNEKEYTSILPAGVYQGTYDWVTGEIESTAYKVNASDYSEGAVTGTTSSGLKYIQLQAATELLSMVACNRYTVIDSAVDKNIRIRSSGIYIYDSGIDFDNIDATLSGLEFLISKADETLHASPKAIFLKAGENTVTVGNGEVAEITYGVDTKAYIDSVIGAAITASH